MWTRRQVNALLVVAASSSLLPACGSGSTVTITPAAGKATLPFSQFPQLASAGGSVVVDVSGQFPLVVVRTDESSAAALSATCPHAGCLVAYDGASKLLHCPCHDADFDLAGNVRRGPPPVPLPVYAATVGGDAITVDLG